MAIESEPNSMSRPWRGWFPAACAVAAGAAALMLAWDNARLESELEALKRERDMWTKSMAIPTPAGFDRPVPAAEPAAPRQQVDIATSSAAETSNDQRAYPDPAQLPGRADQPMSMLDAIKASEQASMNNRGYTSSVSPFGPGK